MKQILPTFKLGDIKGEETLVFKFVTFTFTKARSQTISKILVQCDLVEMKDWHHLETQHRVTITNGCGNVQLLGCLRLNYNI